LITIFSWMCSYIITSKSYKEKIDKVLWKNRKKKFVFLLRHAYWTLVSHLLNHYSR
jgi:hypothetical protein